MTRTTTSFLLALSTLLVALPAFAGGPILIFEPTGVPVVYDVTGQFSPFPAPFNPDQGPLGVLSNAEAVALTGELFQTWEDIPSSSIAYANTGQLPFDVNSVGGLIAVLSSPFVSPIVFDADGSIFDAIFGPGSGVIGFAGPNFINLDVAEPRAYIFNGVAVLNGRFLDGDPNNFELSLDSFKATFFHEFGHFSGLDHSQVNGIKFFVASDNPGNPVQPLAPGFVETMFPFLVADEQRIPHKDDVAMISALYPEPGSTSFLTPDGISRFSVPRKGRGALKGSASGAILGTVFFSDGQTPLQGINVIARNVADPLGDAVSFVSGGLFTGNQSSLDLVDFGIPFDILGPADLIGFYALNNLTPGARYQVEIEEINSLFTGGSGVGPQDPTLNIIPGGGGFIRLDTFNNAESGSSRTDSPRSANAISIFSGQAVGGINFAINDIGPDPNEPNDSFAEATPAFLGFLSSGTIIHPSGDVDYYSFTLTETTDILLRTLPFTTGVTPDTTLGLFDSTQTLIAVNVNADLDGDGSPDTNLSQIKATLDPGTYFVAVATWADVTFDKTVDADQTGIGFYRLLIGIQ